MERSVFTPPSSGFVGFSLSPRRINAEDMVGSGPIRLSFTRKLG
jgi:hypothetical protein